MLKAVSSTEIDFCTDAPQAGFHMYAPLAAYPMYITKEPLEAGEYIFVSATAVTKEEAVMPDIKITDGRAEIKYNKTVKRIELDGVI